MLHGAARRWRPAWSVGAARRALGGPVGGSGSAAGVRERAALEHGVRLTQAEAEALVGGATRRALVRERARALERESLLAAVEQPANDATVGGRWLPLIAAMGNASFAIAGTQLAGDSGMNIVGCTFVGCASALGGATLNNLAFGAARHGVDWVTRPHGSLFVALAASVLTFFTWPLVCQALAEKRLLELQDTAHEHSYMERARVALGLQKGETVSRSQFIAACAQPEFLSKLRKALAPQLKSEGIEPAGTAPAPETKLKKILVSAAKPAEAAKSVVVRAATGTDAGPRSESAPAPPAPPPVAKALTPVYTPEQLFEFLDEDKNKELCLDELGRLIKFEYDGSVLRYMLDTAAFSASSVTAPAAAIRLGLHPVVCVVASITNASGSLLRDLLCDRPMALGNQSFAASTASGATVYVVLRELTARMILPLPISLRLLIACSTTVLVRTIDYGAERPLLSPMHTSIKSRGETAN
jgi:uncharacterized membrane protein YeiH